MEEVRDPAQSSETEIGEEALPSLPSSGQNQENAALLFLDSMDSYLVLFDSLSATLRQGWLEIASARHSMGVSRINSTLLDLKHQSAATSLRVTQYHVDSGETQPEFSLCKWASSDSGDCFQERRYKEDKLEVLSNSSQLRYRTTSQSSDTLKETSLKKDDPVQRERLKSLSMFGTLVSPKLRAAQLSFETALETLVEVANKRASILSTFDQVKKEMEGTKG